MKTFSSIVEWVKNIKLLNECIKNSELKTHYFLYNKLAYILLKRFTQSLITIN